MKAEKIYMSARHRARKILTARLRGATRPRRRVYNVWLLILIAGMFVGPDASYARNVPLRISEPVDSVVADLESYIPDRMNEAGVPGLAIALIRDGRIVWTDGFGVANRLTGEPVSSKTVFEAASISKVVNAYTALRLVEEGELSLDEPAHTYLEEPWLPPSAPADKITLRHLLSHSSGLGDDTFFKNKRIAFEPGAGFLYSGIGAEYARALIEQVSERPLEEVAREKVFDPLGMSSSSFVDEPHVMTHMANGHMRYLLPFLVFLVPFISLVVIAGVIALIVSRFVTGRWRLARRLNIGVCVFAFALTVLLLYNVMGTPFPNLIWVAVLCAAVFAVFLFLSYMLLRRLLSYMIAPRGRTVVRGAVTTLWMIISFIVFLTIVNSVTGPVPKNGASEASAVGSLRTTAPDLATFLIEIARPRYLGAGLASQIDSVQVHINEDYSWGLGMGIQHTVHGDALWQNAITFAFRGIMVVYPREGHGVVVLTNSESGLPVAYDVAERALGGEAKWQHF